MFQLDALHKMASLSCCLGVKHVRVRGLFNHPSYSANSFRPPDTDPGRRTELQRMRLGNVEL